MARRRRDRRDRRVRGRSHEARAVEQTPEYWRQVWAAELAALVVLVTQ